LSRTLKEVFALFGSVSARPMFGGHGLYHDGVMFALVADSVLYLKVDERSVDVFQEQGLTPFEYEKGGKTLRMSYYTAPESIFDDPEQAREWAVLAFDAALRAKKPAAKSRARKQ
jgi:DNA transformation protein and related proteins